MADLDVLRGKRVRGIAFAGRGVAESAGLRDPALDVEQERAVPSPCFLQGFFLGHCDGRGQQRSGQDEHPGQDGFAWGLGGHFSRPFCLQNRRPFRSYFVVNENETLGDGSPGSLDKLHGSEAH